jgi:23S rRNA (uracil1939-C5)-methyltransferase
VNRFLIDRLIESALADHQGDSALDLYAGVGLFSRALTGRFRQVTAVESGHSAFRDLVQNLGDRISGQNTTVEEHLARLQNRPDLILADPPRAGLTKHVVPDLTRLQTPCLVIVSCDPATLARDLQGLIAGGYRIHKITLVDLFPQTFHLETVAELRC